MGIYLLYFCVFHKEQYIDLAYLLLESLYKYGEIDETIDVLIYTTTEFAAKMQQNPLCKRVIFKVNDTYKSIPEACKSRLDIFDFLEVSSYRSLLYLDTDILIRRDVKPLFRACTKEVLYAVEEGSLDMEVPYDYWGKTLFSPEELAELEDRTGFSSGVLLFQNTIVARELFGNIRTHMNSGTPHEFHDQPYFVYHAKRAGLIDNQTLKKYVGINDRSLQTTKTILHFAGSPGDHESKYTKMVRYMKELAAKPRVVTTFGSCRVSYVTNNTRLSDVLTYTHTTKEVVQLIRYIKGDLQLAPPYDTICFRTAILRDRPIKYEPLFKNVFDMTDIFLVEVCSRKKYVHANLCLHDIAVDARFPDLHRNTPQQVLEEHVMVKQTDEEIRQDLLEIRDLIFPGKLVVVSHYNAKLDGKYLPSRSELIAALRGICEETGIPFLDPTEILSLFPQEAILQPDLSHYTGEGFRAFNTIVDSFLGEILTGNV